MAVFFQSPTLSADIRPAIVEALGTQPPGTPGGTSAAADKIMAQLAPPQTSGKPNWGRLVIAAILLISLAGAGMYAAQNDKLQAWANVLLHSFEVLLGIVLGLLGGEAAAKG